MQPKPRSPKWVVALPLVAALMAAGCDRAGSHDYTGYVEADLVLVGSERGGRIRQLLAEEGDQVAAGKLLFDIDSDEAAAGYERSRARVGEVTARLADARSDLQRPTDIAVLEAARDRAATAVLLSKRERDRATFLTGKGFAAQASLDNAIATHEANEAALKEAERRIAQARQPSRSGQITAAQAAVSQARQELRAAGIGLAKFEVRAPTEGSVEEVYFRPGEVVNPGQPVLALLPPARLKIRFYVPQADRSGLRIGTTVGVTCDGCRAGMTARISFIARDAEFTPPIILAREDRDRLVYMVEAVPGEGAKALAAGQPVSVHRKVASAP